MNGIHITNLYCDFEVEMQDGRKQLHEVKGFETTMFLIKRRLLEAIYLKEHPDVEYHLIK